MPISLTTIKRLYTKSGNRCAMPKCNAPLIVGDFNLSEICHIRARRKGGPRFDPHLTATEKDEFKNLILLCPTHHTEVDKNPEKYTVDLLLDIKKINDTEAISETSPDLARQATLIYNTYLKKSHKTVKKSSFRGDAKATATDSSVAVAIGGHNNGDINIHLGAKSKPPVNRYPANSIGGDANLTGYVDYLCDLYVRYMSSLESETVSWGKLGKHIKSKFRLIKRSRNHLPAEKFPALVEYIISEKLAKTPVGRKHLRNGTRFCSTFEEWRTGG